MFKVSSESTALNTHGRRTRFHMAGARVCGDKIKIAAEYGTGTPLVGMTLTTEDAWKLMDELGAALEEIEMPPMGQRYGGWTCCQP
jgi:hypothetical protein